MSPPIEGQVPGVEYNYDKQAQKWTARGRPSIPKSPTTGPLTPAADLTPSAFLAPNGG